MDFATLIQHPGPVLFEGAMGTELERRGATMGGKSNLSHPDAVLAVHRDYQRCGCAVLMTNTLTMNRLFLQGDPGGVDLRAVNLAGARLAREVAGAGGYVLGNIGPTGKLLKPYGPIDDREAVAAFAEQAGLLQEGGVDGFIIETMMDLREAICALTACRARTGRPVIVTIAFKTVKNGGRTMMGHTAADCAVKLEAAGAAAVGANCGDLDAREMAAVIAAMREATRLPILAEPNAGKPRLEAGRVRYDLPVGEFVRGLEACLDAGATMVGGCCGTTPAHIAALGEALCRRGSSAFGHPIALP